MIRKILAAAAIIGGVLAAAAGVASADPDFGPGNSNKGPHDPGALCHPPGQTAGFPACK
jgi:hypothetical protein